MTKTLIVALLLAMLAAVWQWREATAEGARADAEKAARQGFEQRLQETAAARTEETRRADRLQEALDAAHKERLAVEADARRAVSADVSLRGELSRLASRARAAAQDSAAAAEREAAIAAVPVLTEMLGQCSERRTELARYADEARAAGQLCERAYDSLNAGR